MRAINKFIIHHLGQNPQKSGVSMDLITLGMITRWHFSRFKVNKCQYHYVIFPDGTVKNPRKDEEISWHCKGQNDNSIGISIVGDFEQEYPTNEQLDSLGKLLISLCEKYALGPSDVHPHKTYSQTLCPGKNLIDRLPNVLHNVSMALNPVSEPKKTIDNIILFIIKFLSKFGVKI